MGTTDAEKVKLSITCPANKQEYIYLGKGFVIEKDYGNIPLAIDRPGNHKKAGNCINIVFLDGHLASKTLPDHVKTINDVIDFLASEDPKITSSAVARLKANAAQYKDITITSKPVRKNLLARLTNSSADDYNKGVEYAEKSDYTNAVYWYRKAAEQGFAKAQNNLGYCYEYAKGVEQSYYEAVNWYRKAAEQGNAGAQFNLGQCYSDAKGVEQSFYEATKWFRKAAEQGHAAAQNNLGYCYEYGKGVEQSFYEAVNWHRK
ncbi:MAG: sel1 repeat family protein, partial [Lentisphaeria bacterium]|nr:sel1 repeat family protein [Lentisphaeria bacterium]